MPMMATEESVDMDRRVEAALRDCLGGWKAWVGRKRAATVRRTAVRAAIVEKRGR